MHLSKISSIVIKRWHLPFVGGNYPFLRLSASFEKHKATARIVVTSEDVCVARGSTAVRKGGL